MNLERNTIRRFQSGDEAAVVRVWFRSGRAAYTYLPGWQSLSKEHAGQVFRDVIRARCEIWVGTDDEQVVAYLAMNGSYVDRMYVDPDEWRKGWGKRLIAHAKSISPQGLELHTHQENQAACRFYEKHGFLADKLGTSPFPECAPDVEYRWSPG